MTIDYSKLTDEQLQAITDKDYSKLPEDVLLHLADEHDATESQGAELPNAEMSSRNDPLNIAGAGALAGAAAGVGSKSLKLTNALENLSPEKGLIEPIAPTAPPKEYFSPGQKYMAKTGYGSGPGLTQEEVLAHQNAQQAPLGKGKIASKIIGPTTPDEILAAAAQREEDSKVRARVLAQEKLAHDQAQAEYAIKQQQYLKQKNALAQEKKFGFPNKLGTTKAITGATAGYNAADMAQQYGQGDYGQAALSGFGLAGSAAPYIKKLPPKYRAIGAGLSLLSPVVNRSIDAIEAPQQKATGGMVHLAGGGGLLSNIGTQAAWNAPVIAPAVKDISRAVKTGNYSPAVESGLDLAWGLAPINPVTAAMFMASPNTTSSSDVLERVGPNGKMTYPAAEESQTRIAMNEIKNKKAEQKEADNRKFMNEFLKARPHMAGGKRVIAEEALGLAKKIFTPRETKILRASEALAPHEGKWLNLTQSDRMRSTEGDLGGPGFSKFQLEHPDYAEAQAAWGVGKKPTASGIVNVNKRYPEGQSIWAPMIGSETQHHSNQHVYDALTNEFNRQAGMGKLPPELQARINARMQNAPSTKGMFPEGFDIGNPEHLAQYGDTFNRRGEVSKVLSGEGVGGTKGRVIDYPGIMQEMTDPMTMGAPTHSMGTRLFNLTGEVEHRPDLHSAFPYILKGEDQGVAFAPVPKELGIQDFINQFKEFKGREPGYYDLTRTTPSQQITDKYLKSLDEAGHKKGGKVKKAKK